MVSYDDMRKAFSIFYESFDADNLWLGMGQALDVIVFHSQYLLFQNNPAVIGASYTLFFENTETMGSIVWHHRQPGYIRELMSKVMGDSYKPLIADQESYLRMMPMSQVLTDMKEDEAGTQVRVAEGIPLLIAKMNTLQTQRNMRFASKIIAEYTHKPKQYDVQKRTMKSEKYSGEISYFFQQDSAKPSPVSFEVYMSLSEAAFGFLYGKYRSMKAEISDTGSQVRLTRDLESRLSELMTPLNSKTKK